MAFLSFHDEGKKTLFVFIISSSPANEMTDGIFSLSCFSRICHRELVTTTLNSRSTSTHEFALFTSFEAISKVRLASDKQEECFVNTYIKIGACTYVSISHTYSRYDSSLIRVVAFRLMRLARVFFFLLPQAKYKEIYDLSLDRSRKKRFLTIDTYVRE